MREAVCALGVFDGVHLGHRKIISRAKKHAEKIRGKCVIVSFDRHPQAVVGRKAPEILTSSPRKAYLLSKSGADKLIFLPFNRRFASQTPENFVRKYLAGKLRLRRIVVGTDFKFGRNRRGNVNLLKKLGKKYGFEVEAVPTLKSGRRKINSTLIRKTIRMGDVSRAAELLGRFHSVAGRVVKGKGLGAKIGFPTANLGKTAELLPGPGVYAVLVKSGRRVYRGAANVGINTETKHPLAEVFIFGFNRNIYGESAEIHFIRKIRAEKKFSGVKELSHQIRLDVARVKKYFTIRQKCDIVSAREFVKTDCRR